MFAQMATTAAGVAVGSAVGHTIGAAMTGGLGGRSHESDAPQQVAQPSYPVSQAGGQQYQAPNEGPCQFEMKQFLECSQTQYDITLCQGFNEALRQCRISNGVAMQQ